MKLRLEIPMDLWHNDARAACRHILRWYEAMVDTAQGHILAESDFQELVWAMEKAVQWIDSLGGPDDIAMVTWQRRSYHQSYIDAGSFWVSIQTALEKWGMNHGVAIIAYISQQHVQPETAAAVMRLESHVAAWAMHVNRPVPQLFVFLDTGNQPVFNLNAVLQSQSQYGTAVASADMKRDWGLGPPAGIRR